MCIKSAFLSVEPANTSVHLGLPPVGNHRHLGSEREGETELLVSGGFLPSLNCWGKLVQGHAGKPILHASCIDAEAQAQQIWGAQ